MTHQLTHLLMAGYGIAGSLPLAPLTTAALVLWLSASSHDSAFQPGHIQSHFFLEQSSTKQHPMTLHQIFSQVLRAYMLPASVASRGPTILGYSPGTL